ncbi:hypothetical protein L6164_004768 [Bauhinia variegata]|uniref:Uncharacterized protein n=1 Tax=Bauhinia variegata TaxID=167791 RepID=A0ACB9PUN8_BAUVA|nr:hypothetical protein L6164_004768 [Bauhinia variegata]
MDTKEDAESCDGGPPSEHVELQQMSEEATRVADETLQSVCSDGGANGGSGDSSVPPMAPGHRRSQSELVPAGFRRSNSFQKLKTQVQKAWRWGGRSHEEGLPANFNPEVLANQKRQWYQLHPKTMDGVKYKEPNSLFEQMLIVGLHPDTNLESVVEAFAKRKKWEKEIEKSEFIDSNSKELQQQGPPVPTLEPQILFKYPPGKRLTMRMKDLASFCFPNGIKARMLERTPSLSELNELVYGQGHLGRDDSAFIFSLKAADDATLYGVCLHVPEIVQRPPGILGTLSPLSVSSGMCSRFLVSAPRCYCLLTRIPFFELHFEMLNSLIAQERLNRITQFVNEMNIAATDFIPSTPKADDHISANADSLDGESPSDWMASAIPVDGAAAMTAAAAGITSDEENPHFSSKISDPPSPEIVTASDASYLSRGRDVDKDGRKHLQDHDEIACGELETHPDALERMDGNYENGHTSPEIGTPYSSRSHVMERMGSSESLFSPVRSMVSEVEDDLFANNERAYGDELFMEWARENKNDMLQIVCGYHALSIPPLGSKFIFQPLEHLQAIEYRRPSVSDFGFPDNYLSCFEPAQVDSKLGTAEEAYALSLWSTATICRVLSLESVLALVAGVLLEKQMILVCPNLGVLSAAVLSFLALIRPFQWQSLFLPVLPGSMLDFLDAPVPYLVGIESKPSDLKLKTTNLVLVDVLKDQVRTCPLPRLPQHRELITQLGPFHARLRREQSIAKKHPIYRCTEAQGEAATQFLHVMRSYLESLCSDLRSHTITSVQSDNDRVCLLLKDSFITSFPIRDQPFVKLFVDTQLFTVLSDSRLSSFENGY